MMPQFRHLLPAILLCCLSLHAAPVDQWFQFPLPAKPAAPADAHWLLTPAKADQAAVRQPAHLLFGHNSCQAVGPVTAPLAGRYRLELEVVSLAGTKRHLIRDDVLFAPAAVDVVLVVDTSDSMRTTDPNNLRITAIEHFLALAQQSRRIRQIGLISFQSDARTIWRLSDPATRAVTDNLRRALAPRSSTDFDKPLAMAAKLLDDSRDAAPTVIFFSDGKPKRDYQDSHQQLVDLNCRIHTIGLSAETDPTLMRRIAADTGGTCLLTESADDLTPFFAEVFNLIDPPASLNAVQLTADQSSATLVVDDTIRHPRLKIAARTATTCQLDDQTIALASGGLYETNLTTGTHHLRGSGNLVGELVGSSPFVLRHAVVNLEAPSDEPVAGIVGLTEASSLTGVSYQISATGPNGALTTTTQRTANGLLHWQLPAATAPGNYRIQLTATGNFDGATIIRSALVTFHRDAAAAPAAAAAAPVSTGIMPSTPLQLPGINGAPIAIGPLSPPSLAPATSRATFLAEPASILFPDTAPGLTTKATTTVLVSSAAASPYPVRLSDAPAGLFVTPASITPNRQTELTITWAPTAKQAGNPLASQIRIGDQWSIPVNGTVIQPTLTATIESTTINDPERRATSELLVAIDQGQELTAQVTSNLPELTLSQSQLTLSAGEPVRLTATLAALEPAEQLIWQGTITIAGPGLKPVTLPLQFEFPPPPEVAEPAPPPPLPPPAPPAFNWIPWLLLLLAIILVALAIAGIRGNQRAVFILASVGVHVLLLLLVLPKPEQKKKAADAVTELLLQSGGTIQESEISAETTEFSQQQAEPTAAISEPVAESTPITPPTTTPQEIDASQPEIAESAETREIELEVERQATTAPDVQTPETAPDKRRETAQRTEATPATAETTPVTSEAPRPQVAARIRLEPAPEVTPLPETPTPVTKPTTDRATPELTDIKVKPTAPSARREEQTPTTAQPLEATTATAESAQQPTPAAPTSRTLTPATAAADSQVTPDAAAPQVPRSDGPTATKAVASIQLQRNAPAKSAQAAPTTAAALPASTSAATANPSDNLPPVSAPATASQRLDAPQPAHPAVTHSADQLPPVAPARTVTAMARLEPRQQPTASNRRRASSPPTITDATGPLQATRAAANPVPTSAPASNSTSTPNRQLAPAPVTAPAGTTTTAASIHRPNLSATSQSLPDATSQASATLNRRTATAPTGTAAPQSAGGSTNPAAPVATAASNAATAAAGQPLTTASAATGYDAGLPTGTAPNLVSAPPPASETLDLRLTTTSGRRRHVAGGSQLGPLAAAPAQRLPANPAAAESTRAAPLPLPTVDEFTDARETPAAAAPQLTRNTTSELGRRAWQQNLVLARYGGDWDCDRTAMLNLAHQLERRTGSVIPLSSRTVPLSSPELSKVPFIFLSGHDPFDFTTTEVNNLRNFLTKGGSAWINDSTDLGDNRFDAAVRKQLKRILPAAQIKRIPANHPIFAGPYDLTKGFHGYAIPPGDKYRQDYLEGIWIDGRLAVVYTRNDYGDGLEINPHTHPLMESLSGLSPAQMQEGSVRMGINVTMHLMNGGRPVAASVSSRVREAAVAADQQTTNWQNLPATAVNFGLNPAWNIPEGWQDLIPASLSVTNNDLKLTLAEATDVPVRRRKVAVGTPTAIPLTAEQIILADVTSGLSGGSRIALAFMDPDGNDYLESAPIFLKPGQQTIAFDLGQPSFKSAATDWAYKANFPANRQIGQWFFILYPQAATGTIDVRQIRTAKRP